jgi:hypothetical protein
MMESQWASALRGAGRVSDSIAHNKHALSQAEALHNDAPASAQYRVDVGVIERSVSEGLLLAGDAVAALRHAKRAEAILCRNLPAANDPFTLATCGHSLVTAGKAQLALSEPLDAAQSFREAEKIASLRSQAEPLNAIFRSDWARSEAALADGLVELADYPNARAMYDAALNNWSLLRQTNSLSAEDAHRAENATRAVAAISNVR